MMGKIENLATPGFVADIPDLLTADGAWTDSRNVRYRDGAAEKFKGYTACLGSLSATSIFAAPITDGANSFWVYGSNTVLYATDGTTHANVSHLSVTYAATDDLGWTGGAFHGFMLANDGLAIPQSWSPGLGNRFTSLTAWPSITCKVMRPFKDFIFALRITDTGVYNPRVLRWSDAAQQGALPGSWDYTDPTNQAGITELGQTQDSLVDAIPLRDSLIVYKDSNTWLADFVGGSDVFGFRQVFSQVGMLTENCGLAFGSQHLVLTDTDVVLHDGNSVQSILDKRARRWLFNAINTARYKRCFMVADYRNREAHVCIPESGYDWPNLSLCWNWAENTLQVMDWGGPKTYGAFGIIPAGGASSTFDTDSTTFEGDAVTFDETTFNSFQSRVLMLDSTKPLAYQNDTGDTYNGQQMTTYATRTGMGLTSDFSRIKRVKRILPRIIGTAGDTVRFYIGSRAQLGDSTLWSGPYTFTIGTDYKIDLRISARILDMRFEYSGVNTFRFHTVEFEFEADGYR